MAAKPRSKRLLRGGGIHAPSADNSAVVPEWSDAETRLSIRPILPIPQIVSSNTIPAKARRGWQRRAAALPPREPRLPDSSSALPARALRCGRTLKPARDPLRSGRRRIGPCSQHTRHQEIDSLECHCDSPIVARTPESRPPGRFMAKLPNPG